MLKLLNLVISFTLLINSYTSVDANFSATLLDVKIPGTVHGASAFYDGDDSIYLFGGYSSGTYPGMIYKINISQTNPSLESVTYMDNGGGYGSVQSDKDGNLIYAKGFPSPNHIYMFDPKTKQTSELGVAPYGFLDTCSFKNNDSSNTIYYAGGGGSITNQIVAFDTTTATFNTVGLLPCFIQYPTSATVNGNAFIIGNSECSTPILKARSVMKLNLETFETEMGPANFPSMDFRASAVSDGSNVYVIGGYNLVTSGTITPTNGIIRLNPETFQWTFLQVDNFPVGPFTYFEIAPATVYVKKMERIYMFGGVTFDQGWIFNDQVWYIDLNPTTV